MTHFILLTEEESNAVRGESIVNSSASIMPIQLTNLSYIVNSAVLDDPDHIQHKDFLSSLPTISLEEVLPLLPVES